MATVMTNLKISQDKTQLKMAEKFMNPYDLCSKAGISYASYRRIMTKGSCKIATLGKIANALGVDVTGSIQYQWQGLRRHKCPIDIVFACD